MEAGREKEIVGKERAPKRERDAVGQADVDTTSDENRSQGYVTYTWFRQFGDGG